jgi:signal transduction histidine kinase
VLINLLTNAIKYTPENTSIEINVKAEKEWVFFTVRDHGKGIEEKYLPKVFDRYFRVPGSTEKSGTGLGLAISKEFIEAQGGKIWVHSTFGSGAEFGFSLPAVREGEPGPNPIKDNGFSAKGHAQPPAKA